MFITVRLLTHFFQDLTYSVPCDMQQEIVVGSIVLVPLQRRTESAIVIKIDADKTVQFSFKVRPIHSVYPFPCDTTFYQFALKLAQLHQIDPWYVFKKVKSSLSEQQEEDLEIQPTFCEKLDKKSVVLTDEQEHAYDLIKSDIAAKRNKVTLLHGVTGSGKTEVYKKLCQDVIAQGKAVMLLLPEVSLAIQFEKIFKDQLEGLEIFTFHSVTTVSAKKKLWQALLQNRPCIILGVHLPVFLPIAHLGIIIIDEEHEAGYQEKSHPKINTKNTALLKAFLLNIPVVLGSATPSITSLWNVEHKSWRLVELRHRFAGQFPKVQVVSLSDKKERKNFWVSAELYTAIQKQLITKEQTIIFINRRGFSFFVQCMTCSFIFSCRNCSVSLTLHENGTLLCHYCKFMLSQYEICPDCKGKDFLKKGVGTQQVVAILQKLFPYAKIERADADTTAKKKSWQKTVQDFYDKKIDILVGTQSIAKGYHFPHVTLVGILWADVNLHFPMYNASETTLQQLIQVAGRAGRQSVSSRVIVQTMTPHKVFDFICEADYKKFYTYEVAKRSEVGYPPAKHIAEIEIRHHQQDVVEKDADRLADFLIQSAQGDLLVLGPVPAIIYRVQKTYCQKIFIKSLQRAAIIDLFARAKQQDYASTIFFTVDPVA
jgi:primosomal protein N' (replication factor Y)